MDNKLGKWDLPDLIATAMSLIALLRGQAPEAATRGPDSEAHQKTVSSFKAMFSKEDEGTWVSLLAALDVPEQDALTLVQKELTGVGEVDSFRLAIVNGPNATHTEETRDPAKPKVVTKKVTHVSEFSNKDNRVKLLKKIAARNTKAAVEFVRLHHLAVENPVTKYGPALLDQITAKISARKKVGWLDILKSIPIAIWIMSGGTLLLVIAIAIKIHFIDY